MPRKCALPCVPEEALSSTWRTASERRPAGHTEPSISLRELTGAVAAVGLRSDDNRKFFREDSLTLQKVTDICRTVETAQEQIQILSEDHVLKCIRRNYRR